MAFAWKLEINYPGGKREKGRSERRKEGKEEGDRILLENILNMANPKQLRSCSESSAHLPPARPLPVCNLIGSCGELLSDVT